MATSINFADASKQALTVLTTNWYNQNPPAQYGDAYWIDGGFLWESGNALEILLDYQINSGDSNSFGSIYDQVYTAFSNSFSAGWFGYYDDEGWWGVSCLKAYELTQDKKWLTLAQTIYGDLQGGWDMVCGGGIWFRRNPKSYDGNQNFKGAISNLLMMVLSGRFYNSPSVGGDAAYLNWAVRTWNWLLDSGLMQPGGFVTGELGANAQPVPDFPTTYLQGVLIGGAIELYKATGERSYLQQAIKAANATAQLQIWPSGILQEGCERTGAKPCDNDGAMFKGIFMRYLSYLCNTLSNLGSVYATELLRYQQFIQLNATTLWNAYPNATFGLNWNGGSNNGAAADAVVQISATAALVSAIPATSLPG